MVDARYEDMGSGPLNLGAEDPDDLEVISALCQDAVIKSNEIEFSTKRRQMALLLQRFRWEDEGVSPPERVQSVFYITQVQAVKSKGIDRAAENQTLSLLSVEFAQTQTPSGVLTLHFSGGAALRLEVEALELQLRDVTRPYLAVTGKKPRHELD